MPKLLERVRSLMRMRHYSYETNAGKEWAWQYVFPSKVLSVNPRSGQTGRHHVSPSSLQKPFKAALR
jgi:hypothetical protein